MKKFLDFESLLAELQRRPDVVVWSQPCATSFEHVEIINPSRIYSCKICHLLFKSEKEQAKHTRKSHTIRKAGNSSARFDLIKDLS